MKATIAERHIRVAGGQMYCRTSNLRTGKPNLLMIHGLGESGLCFNEAFDLLDMNLIVPDLLGFGRSTCDIEGVDYSCEAQAKALWELVDALGIESFGVVGHSIGGDLGTIMTASELGQKRIRGFINVEGNITASDTFISGKAFRANRAGKFAEWYRDEFMRTTVFDGWARERASGQRYFAALNFCKPQAFLALAQDAVMKNLPRIERPGTEIGELFQRLGTPHCYYWAPESLSEESAHFLKSAEIQNRRFEKAGHWVMIDQASEFYSEATEFFEGLDW